MNKEIEESKSGYIMALRTLHHTAMSGDDTGEYEAYVRTLEDRLLTTLRHTWLQQEIEVLKGMLKNTDKEYDYVPPHEEEWNRGYDYGYNQALQTIIDRYKEELNQK